MIDTLLYYDYRVFYIINSLPHVFWSDAIARFFSGIGTFGFIWIFFGVLMFINEEHKSPRFFAPFLASGIGAHIVSSLLLKPWISRLRPMHLVQTIVVDTTGGYSFPSTHAAVSFALAEVLSRYEPGYRVVWYTIAVFISLSRVYLGVHYPIDILAGAILGWGIGNAACILFRRDFSKRTKK